jgi:hypothetical protein
LNFPSTIGLQYAKANLFPSINIYGNNCCDSPYPGTNTIYAQNTYQPSDVVTLIRGKHILHFGGELIMLECNCAPWGNVDAGDFTFSGSYTQASQTAIGSGGAWADFLLGDVNSWGVNPQSPVLGSRQKSPQVFIQDDFKLRPNLTLNLGLRYQIQRGWAEVKERLGDFDPTILNTVSGNYGAMWFAPRITVLRPRPVSTAVCCRASALPTRRKPTLCSAADLESTPRPGVSISMDITPRATGMLPRAMPRIRQTASLPLQRFPAPG